MSTATDVSNADKAMADLEALNDKQESDRSEFEALEKTRRRLERVEMRGVGRMQLTVNYPRDGTESEDVPFVRLPINEASELLEEIDKLNEQNDVQELRSFLIGSLEGYCLDPDRDADHWGRELTIGDAIGLLRNIAFGGNPPT